MTFFVPGLGIGLVLLASVGASVVAQPKYELRRPCAFSIGATVQSRTTWRTQETVRRRSDNAIVQERTLHKTDCIHTEVIQVDDQGHPLTLRHHILNARSTTKIMDASGHVESHEVELRGIRYRSRRTGIHFRPDASSVKVPASTILTDSQVQFLRDGFLAGAVEFAVRPPGIVDLLPEKPVSVGEEWTPTAAELRKYSRSHAALHWVSASITSARLRLEQVREGVAHVVGRLEVNSTDRSMPCSMEFKVSASIDLERGLVHRRGMEADHTMEGRRVAVALCLRNGCSASMIPGTGVASPEPEGLKAIHLPESGLRADGSYVNPKFGLRLNVPSGYHEFRDGMRGTTIASFMNESSYPIEITASEVPRGTSAKESATRIKRDLAKDFPRYEVVKEEVVELPRGNSGYLITARFQCRRGRCVLQTLILLGDKSTTKAVLFGISAGAVAHDTAHIKVLRAALMTAAAKPPRPPEEDG